LLSPLGPTAWQPEQFFSTKDLPLAMADPSLVAFDGIKLNTRKKTKEIRTIQLLVRGNFGKINRLIEGMT
jgi:hypothetical protein